MSEPTLEQIIEWPSSPNSGVPMATDHHVAVLASNLLALVQGMQLLTKQVGILVDRVEALEEQQRASS